MTTIDSTTTTEHPAPRVDDSTFDLYVELEADDLATPEQLDVLEADKPAWRSSLLRLLVDADEHLVAARRLTGEERDQVVADAEYTHRILTDALVRLTGERRPAPPGMAEPQRSPAKQGPGGQGGQGGQSAADGDGKHAREPEVVEPGVVRLQLSWEPGRVVAWAGGPGCPVATGEEVAKFLAAAEAPAAPWVSHPEVNVPGGEKASAVSAPVGEVLGWLVAAGSGDVRDDVGPSVRWLGKVAMWAVELAARGAMVPVLRQRRRRSGSSRGDHASYAVRWTPALVDPDRLADVVDAMPGSVAALDPSVDARAVTRSALTGMVDAIGRDSARRIEVPAAPPVVRTGNDVTEAFLARLDGSAFDAPTRVAGELVSRAEQWSRSVTREHAALIVRLDPPDRTGVWDLEVFVAKPRASTKGKGGSGGGKVLVPVERAIVDDRSKRSDLDHDVTRLERMLPALLRAGTDRRGHTILSQEEAWELMTVTGPRLADAGFDVRVPELSTRKATPSLRLFTESKETAVGANQLANVSWSAVFDDVELTAAQIRELAKEARPLIRSGGKWVALDKADLRAAADALAAKADTTQLTGADMLRLALGLEGTPLAGGISVEGGGWAAELLAAASDVSGEPAKAPKGFDGELRSYQAEALAWLGFLDAGGIGGCLALDMGLGKTPTMLAHLLAANDRGPALVVAPPAVVGNWAAEAARFTPGLRVLVHHGPGRAAHHEIADEVDQADVVITTYGTAVRDIDAIAKVDWACLVLDEAQAVKNHTNETAQQLRKIGARTRVALTGTPIENGLGDLWAILDFTNPGLVGGRPQFIASLSGDENGGGVAGGAAGRAAAEDALRALNGILVFRRTKLEPEIQAELPDKIDQLDHCAMTAEQIGLYQAVLDRLVLANDLPEGEEPRKGQILAAITALKQICNHPAAYQDDDRPLEGRSGKLARLEEIVESVFAAEERVLVFTHFAEWGMKLADHLTKKFDQPIECYHGGLSRGVRDAMVKRFQEGEGPAALVLSLKAGGTGLNLTAANHVVL
ncbi:MAG TPA: SNF2-related protein, partial [Acidimicrobiia bacterium]